MRTITSLGGKVENVTLRRTESSDAHEINSLIGPDTVAVFGRVNVIHLLERANLAVTLNSANDKVLAHAAFSDHPMGGIVDQAGWEPFLCENYGPLNTLFLHLFVAQPDFSVGSAKEIVRTVFSAVTELQCICLVTTTSGGLGECVCHNGYCGFCYRVEDSDDLTHIFAEQTTALTESYGPYFLAELVEAQDEEHHAAVCENEGTAVGFISVSGDINLKLLNEHFELGPFDGLYKPSPEQMTELAPEAEGHRPPVSHHLVRPWHLSTEFLPYVFQLFPDRDFCVISVPKLAPELPLLQNFHRVVPHHTSILPEELYIFHRSGLLKTFAVRLAVTGDRPAVCVLVKRLSQNESLLEDLDMYFQARRDTNGTALQAFVAQVQNQVVGIVIIRNEEDIDYIRANYNIESFIYFSHHGYEEHGQLCHFVLNPIFQHYSKHLLKEVLRLAHKSCLYYRVFPSYHKQRYSCASVLNCMVPVRPRHQIVYPLEELGINAPSIRITKDQVPYALNHINRKLTLEPKVTINARIVVVGASDTEFVNFPLNSPLSSLSHCYGDRDHAQLSLRSWINVVMAKMVGIDRAAKNVLLSGGQRVPFDHLVLCTGQQYQVPCPTGVDICNLPSDVQLPDRPHRRYTGPVPSNLLTLNDHHDCVTAYRWLQIISEGNAVVYGNTIDAYTCAEALLRMGVQGSRIHLVHLPAAGASSCSPGSCFSNPMVKKAVEKALEKTGVHVHLGCTLAQMNDGQHPEPITSLSFTSDGQPLRLECSVFINFSSKGVDYDAFKTISDACLVYDGRLVIDAAFHTNDPAIRAAGPLTKFSRRYHADRWSHSDFNPREVGQDLAASLLAFFDPTLAPAMNPPADLDRLIPNYTRARIQGGRLPGGYNYLHVTKPGIEQRPCSGKEILTGRIETGNYFHLQLNQYEMVETITCLSLKPFPVSNYLCLYGKHQLLLNRLCCRYDEGLVHDLYSYFKEKWCLAIYHDRFPDFEKEIQQIIESTKVQDHSGMSIAELIHRMVDDKLDFTEEPDVFLKKVFESSGGLASLKTSTLNYLSFNRFQLTMYAQPGLL
uniref:Cilia- and flagella-associated protein 61 N-terminal domain-containing protein n=1 Tax=Esox lucius TaxID=8010 RepID=A0AAY5K1P9_ESOLU